MASPSKVATKPVAKAKAPVKPSAPSVSLITRPLEGLTSPNALGKQGCACGGQCPRCAPRQRAALERLGIASPGIPLPHSLRSDFLMRTGQSVNEVRLHTDAQAAAVARAARANAFTLGNHIVFGAGRYSPGSARGRRLIFHELVHVLQQQGASPATGLPFVSKNALHEQEAILESPRTRLASQIIQCEDETEAPPAPVLGEGESFRWIGPNEAPTLIISTAWLRRQRVPTSATEILGRRFPQVIRPVLLGLLPRYPWAAAARAEAGVPQAYLHNITSQDWRNPEMRFHLWRSVFLILGLPPSQPVQVFASESGIEYLIDMSTFFAAHSGGAPLSAEARQAAKGQAAAALIMALEQAVGSPLTPTAAAILEQRLPLDLPDTPTVYQQSFTDDIAVILFGENIWRSFVDTNPMEQGAPGALLHFGDSTFHASPQLTPEDVAFAQGILREILGEPDPNATPPANPDYLSRSDVLALRVLDQHPDRAEIIDQFRRARELRGTGDTRASLQDLIETAAARVDWERAEGMTRFDPEGGGDRELAIVPRPVRGQITNPDRLVPGMEAQFRFQTLDRVDAFRVSHVRIHWEAWKVETDEDGNVSRTFIDDDNTNYIETRAESFINERTFDLTFNSEGDYEIHAFVDHNFYLPAHFLTRVRVKTESARAGEARAATAESFGEETSVNTDYRFTEINEEEFWTGFAAAGPLGALAVSALSDRYEQGSRAEGTLVDRIAGDATYAFDSRLTELDAEIERLNATILALTGTGSGDVLEYLRERRDRLNTARDRVLEIYGTPGSTGPTRFGVATQAFFISRRAGIRNTRLKLLCWYETEGPRAQQQFHLHLIDQTELTESDHYEFDVQTADFEAGMRHLFLELGRSYPDGTLSFAFQVHTREDGATNRLVRYERVTDTLNNDVRDVVFSTAVNLTVNLIALLLTLFPPTAPIGIALGLAYNAAALAATHGEDLRTGTLHAGRLTLDIGMLALDLIPALGRLTGRFTLGTVAYRSLELTQFAGMVVMISDDGIRSLTHLRDTQMTELAELQQQIRDLEDVNASAPELDSLRERERQLIAETRQAAVEVFTELATTQGLILGSTMLIGHVAAPHLTTPRRTGETAPVSMESGEGGSVRIRPEDTTSAPRPEEGVVPPPPREASEPEPVAADAAERTAAGRGDGTPPHTPPPTSPANPPDYAHSPDALLDLLRRSEVLPPPLPREAVVNPLPDNSTFARGHFTAAEAYGHYTQALAVSLGREIGIFHNPATGEYCIRIGHEVGVSGPGAGFRAVVHYHPNPHNAFQLRLPAPADIFDVTNLTQAFGRGVPVREVVEFNVPGRGRGRIEYGLEPGQAEPVYLRIFEPGQEPRTLRFVDEVAYTNFWHGHDSMYVAPGSPLYRQLVDGVGSGVPREPDILPPEFARDPADGDWATPTDPTGGERTMAGAGGERPRTSSDPTSSDSSPATESPGATSRPPQRRVVPLRRPAPVEATPPTPTAPVAPIPERPAARAPRRGPNESDANYATRLMEAERRAYWEAINGPAGRARENPVRWGRVERTFSELVTAMENMRERLERPDVGLGNLLPQIDRTPLDSVVDIFVMRNQALRELRDTLQAQLREIAARNNRPLRSMMEWRDLQNFLHGNTERGGVPTTIGNLRPDEVAFLLDEHRIEITDYTTQLVNTTRVTVHAFKSRVYMEVMRSIVGHAGPAVRARDVHVGLDESTGVIDPTRTQEGDWME